MNESELRDALTRGAAVSGTHPGDWTKVEERGMARRQAARRWRAVAAVAAVLIAVGIAGAVASLAGDDETPLIADEPDGSSATSVPPVTSSSAPPQSVTNVRFDGVRTEPGDEHLVLTFTGGQAPTSDPNEPCTVSYAAEVDETAGSITVNLQGHANPPPPPPSDGMVMGCDALGHQRSVRVQLAAPLGDREVRDGSDDRVVPVYRAATMLEPATLPDGYRFRDEAGFDPSWTQWFEGPKGVFGVVQASVDEPLGDLTGCVDTMVRGVMGQFCDDHDSFIVIRWEEGGFRREVAAFEEHSFTGDELVAIAESLRPLS